MNIVGLLINTLPQHHPQVTTQLQALNIEVHAFSEQGQLVVTLEHELDAVISERIAQIQAIPGVLTAAMVYHQVDYNNNNEEPTP